MSAKKNTTFLIVQDNEDARPVIEAVEQDNPGVNIQYQPGMVRMERAGSLIDLCCRFGLCRPAPGFTDGENGHFAGICARWFCRLLSIDVPHA